MTLGDDLNRLENKTIVKYKAIMGDMSDLQACEALVHLFDDSLPMRSLQEVLSNGNFTDWDEAEKTLDIGDKTKE